MSKKEDQISEEAKRRAEQDRFWDIDALFPLKKAVFYASDTTATDILVDLPQKEHQGERSSASDGFRIPSRPAVPPQPAERSDPKSTARTAADSRSVSEKSCVSDRSACESEYTSNHALLRQVQIFSPKMTPNGPRYYERFYSDAVKLYPIRGESCPRVPFFSYVPQYSQLNRAQLEWYLWWREQFRAGGLPDTDYSYLLLYVYELLNLSGRVSPTQTAESLFRLWQGYRDTFRQLDLHVLEWLCDLCLLHRLPPPQPTDAKLRAVLFSHCTLKEFYVSESAEDGYLHALLYFCCNYDYRKSKVCTNQNRSLFERTIFGAMRVVFEKNGPFETVFGKADIKSVSQERNAFVGVPCPPRIRKKILVRYLSFSASYELRFVITNMVKYTENQIRAVWKIRSRLGVSALPNPIRNAIDRYVSQTLPFESQTRSAASEKEFSPAYEQFYEVPHQPFSYEEAMRIERLSWKTTERLLETFAEPTELADAHPDPSPLRPEHSDPCPARSERFAPEDPFDFACFGQLLSGAGGEADGISADCKLRFAPYVKFLRAAADANVQAQKSVAHEVGRSLTVLADELNSLAAEETGDILVEESERGGYTVIPDYLAWTRSLLSLFPHPADSMEQKEC